MRRRAKSNSVCDADGKADFDLLEAELDEQREHLELLRAPTSAARAPGCRRADRRCTSRARARSCGSASCRSPQRDRPVGAVFAVIELAHGHVLRGARRRETSGHSRRVALRSRIDAISALIDVRLPQFRAAVSHDLSLYYRRMPAKLDSFDLKILAELQANGGLSNQEIADRVGLSASPCSRRIHHLEQSRRDPRARRAARAARASASTSRC